MLGAAGISTRFSADLLANVISFGGMAVVGILLNFLIAQRYSVEILGIYNQVYAIYLFLSQLAVGGVHLSILKYVAERDLSAEDKQKIFSPAFLLTFLTAVIISLLVFFGRKPIAFLLKSPGVEVGIAYIAVGLLFFSLNKVLLAFLNAERKMIHFAVFQAVRAVFMLATALIIFKVDSEGFSLPVLYSISEILLFFIILAFTRRSLSYHCMFHSGEWFKRHLVFGFKAMPGNLLMNTYNKFDVLLLGIFAPDSIVGIYSLAAMLLDGYLQLGIVFRNNVNPVLAKKYLEMPRIDFEVFCKRTRNYSFLILGTIGLTAGIAFPLLGFIFTDVDVISAWSVFGILLVGALFGQGYMPLTMLLNQCGFPGSQSVQIALVFATIILFNLALIPLWGIFGAAIATSLTYFLQAIYLKIFTKKAIDIRI